MLALTQQVLETDFMRIALHGHMGRDAAAVDNLLEHGHQINAVGSWENPNVKEAVEASGGQFEIVKNINDADTVADLIHTIKPDLFFTHFDDSLAAGTIDKIQRVSKGWKPPILLASPNQESAKIEWDNFLLREILDKVGPQYNPDHNAMVTTEADAFAAIQTLKSEGIQAVIKPRGLTGGKGVKVMGKHFDSYEEAMAYAIKVLADPNQDGLEVQERMDVDSEGELIGYEFNIQFITDGNVIIPGPVTYDYPYREDGDQGPGTGGMGTFTQADGLLPFLNEGDYQEMVELAKDVLAEMKARGLDFKGVFYLSAIKQKDGKKKVIEVNARGGDPELINIIDLFEEGVDYGEVLRLIAEGRLERDSVRFKKSASAVIYLSSKGYGYEKKEPLLQFGLNKAAVEETGVKIRFAAGEKMAPNRYRTTATSRIVGFSALGATPWEARQRILDAITAGFKGKVPFDFRNDVASKDYLSTLVL